MKKNSPENSRRKIRHLVSIVTLMLVCLSFSQLHAQSKKENKEASPNDSQKKVALVRPGIIPNDSVMVLNNFVPDSVKGVIYMGPNKDKTKSLKQTVHNPDFTKRPVELKGTYQRVYSKEQK